MLDDGRFRGMCYGKQSVREGEWIETEFVAEESRDLSGRKIVWRATSVDGEGKEVVEEGEYRLGKPDLAVFPTLEQWARLDDGTYVGQVQSRSHCT